MQSMATDLILFLFCTDSASFCVRYPQQTHFRFSPKFQIVCPETLVNTYGGFVRIFGKHRSEKKSFWMTRFALRDYKNTSTKQ